MKPAPKRFHGTVTLIPRAWGVMPGASPTKRSRISSASSGSEVKVTLEIEAQIPSGAPDHVVRTVTENRRTLKFIQQGFEEE